MTEKKGKSAVIISKIKSNAIEQAIFILKSPVYDTCTDSGIVAEAQEIINSYIRTMDKARLRRKKVSTCKTAIVACAVCAAILILTAVILKF